MKIAALIVISFLGVIWFAIKENQETTSVTHLIPKGFTGVVTIIHNQTDGVALSDDENLVYQIPREGILITQDPLRAEIRQVKFYYQNGEAREPLEYVWDFNKKERTNNDTVYVYGGSTGTFGQDGKEVDCTTYIVGTLNALDSLSEIQNNIKPLDFLQGR